MMIYISVFLCITMLSFLSNVGAQEWRMTSDGTFEVYTAARADEAHLTDVFAILREAKKDLRLTWGLRLPPEIQIYIHPTLESYSKATELPWYVAAAADRESMQIDMQRIKVLLERDSLEKTLRHELFHLAQEEDLERWQAEGRAMLFSDEVPMANADEDVDAEALNQMLEGFVNREDLARANATAYLWTQLELGE